MAGGVPAASRLMIIYEITATVAPELLDDYERYMREHHIPALLATGCFRSAAITRSTPGRYRMRYEASTEKDLERYLAVHAERLRSEFTEQFPVGIELTREVWTVRQAWSTPGR
jgi:hypothetical protein